MISGVFCGFGDDDSDRLMVSMTVVVVRVLDDDDSVEVEDEDSSSFFNVLQFFRVCYGFDLFRVEREIVKCL